MAVDRLSPARRSACDMGPLEPGERPRGAHKEKKKQQQACVEGLA